MGHSSVGGFTPRETIPGDFRPPDSLALFLTSTLNNHPLQNSGYEPGCNRLTT